MGSQLEAAGTARRSMGDSALDGSLIGRCKDRDVEAFSVIVDHYQARIYGFTRRMLRCDEDAEDVSQEVFIRAFENIDQFDGRASFATWLFKIAVNLCIDRARRKDRRPESVPLEPDDHADAAPDKRWDPETRAVALEMEEAIEAAIGFLSEKLRGVLLLHDIEELSYEQISRIVGIPVGTVKSRLFLARSHLQRALRNYMTGEMNL